MQCKDCGIEVANIGELNRHKKECPAKVNVPVKAEAEVKREEEGKPLIPFEMCDPMLKVLSNGTPIVLTVMGVIRKDGIEVTEVHLKR